MTAAMVAEILARCRGVVGGAVATYIPELGREDPERLAVAVAGLDGAVAAAGDAAPFTLQSICKPLLYGAALERHGTLKVLARVGVEVTGKRFDSIMRLDRDRIRPHNPMINAGAIVVASMLHEAGCTLDVISAYTGRDIEIDEAVYRSENETAHNNRSIVHLLTHLGLVPDPEPALQLYLQACSVRVTCADLAVIAATLASGGVNPRTRVRALDPAHLSAVLTVMATCGMYDGAGTFAMEVGLPAKSGVSGGIIAVAPGRAGLAAFAPPLDEAGNSVRGLEAIAQLARALDVDVFAPRAAGRRPVDLDDALDRVVERQRHGSGGEVAAYAAEIQSPRPDDYAVAICTVGGEVLVRGAADAPFTIQAAANPFAYAVAVHRHGAEAVAARVDCEPSGNRYDAIDVRPGTGRPFNALSNAGALAIADLLTDDDRLDAFAGGPLEVDQAVLAAEHRVGHRNIAIAHRLRGAGVIASVDRAVARYLRQCSLRVDCARLARMGAVLANGGVDPITFARVVGADAARRATVMMYTCGMHDDSGVFAFEIGMPAKSGITGAIVAVVPGVLAVAVYSPRVNARGASVRGWATLRDLAGTLGLGLFERLAAAVPDQVAPPAQA